MEDRSSCNVFVRKRHILVASAARTLAGFELIVDPIFELPVAATPSEIGQAALDAFAAYKIRVPNPGPDLANQPNAILRASGCRSWSQLDKSSRNVFLVRYPDTVVVIPTSQAPEGGVNHLNDQSIKCAAGARDIGEAVQMALAACS